MYNHLFLERKLLIFVLILLFIAPVFADHTASVTISPDVANCDELGNTFTITVKNNNGSQDSIWTVDIYKSSGLTSFDCGNPPSGWSLANYSQTIGLCRYTANHSNYIDPGEQLDFIFYAVMNNDTTSCTRTFHVATLDNQTPTGQYQHNYPTVSVDCKQPKIHKSITSGNYHGVCPPEKQNPGEICWMTHGTIHVTAYDNDTCDLGIDYCEWNYTVDGGDGDSGNVSGNGKVEFDITFDKDSVHNLTIVCYDVVGNKVEDIEVFRVDNTPPKTTKTYGSPHYPSGINDVNQTNYPHWITTHTPVTLTAIDPDPTGKGCNINNVTTYYKNIFNPDNPDELNWYCESYENCMSWQPSNWSDCGWTVYNGSFYKEEESCHIIEYYSKDELGNKENVKWQCVFVDNTPPIGTKIIGDPKKQCEDGEGCDYWVSQNTLITLTCTDQLPHPVDNEKVCYKIYVDNDDKTECYCSHYNGSYNQTTGYCCFSKQTTINFLEDSNHTLEYYCEDALGNKNDVDTEYFKVDSQKPIIDKTLIGPQVGDCPPEYEPDGDTHECWIKDWTCEQGEGTIIHVEANDDDTYGCVVDQVICQWWYTLDGGQDKYYTDEYEIYDGKSGWLTPPFDIKFYDDTVHELHINCTDALGNWYEDVETFYVDSQGPVVNKSFIGPQKIVPMFNYGDVEWIDGVTLVNLTAEDLPDAPCAVGLDKIYWRNELAPSDDWCYYPEQHCTQIHNPQEPGWTNYTGPFNKINESCHILEYYAVDKLGNIGPVGVNCFFVDKTAPNVTKDNGEAIPDSGEGNFTTPENPNGDFHWITTSMPIKFICEDQGPHPSGDEKLCFKVSYDYPEWNYITNDYCEDNLTSDGYCCVSATPESPYTFYFKEESMHNLEYYCVDAVNKSSEKHIQYYKVDDTPPNVTKIINGPYFGQCPPESCEDKCYVDTATNITLEIEDGGEICAVGNVTCKWKYKVNQGDWSDWFIYSEENPISFPEECNHELYIECEDALGNTWSDTEYFIVDKTPPNTTKHYEGPHFKDEETGTEWITNETNITLTAIDPEPHPSGVNKTWYRDVYLENESDWHYCYSDCDEWVNDSKGRATVWDIVNGLPTAPEPYNPSSSRGFMLYEGPFKLQKESCHIIEYYSYDNVGKVEQVKHQCVFVDNTPPEPNKTIGEPKTYCEGEECNSWEWKITTMTPITLSCEDKGPHPVDNSTVYWRIWWDYNDNWTEWHNATEGTKIYLEEKCLHQLEFYCVDALGHESEHDIEKIKVEGTSFNIQLNKKWNLISVPFVMLDDSIDEVFKDVANETEAVWTYDPENEICDDEWCVYTPGEGPDTLDEMTPGWGYWVLMNSSAMKEDSVMLTIGGDLFMEGVKPPDKTIVHGWNLIGYYGTNGLLVYDGPDKEGKPAYCALFDLGESYLDKGWSSLISYWKGDWLEYTYCDNMDPGAGYWLRATENGSYGYTTNCGLGDLIC